MTRCRAVSLALAGLWLAAHLIPATTLAQEAPASPLRDRLWLSAAAGYGRTRHDSHLHINGGLAGGLSLTYQPGVLQFTGRLSTVWDPIDADLVGDLALMLGVGTRARGSHLSISAGPALTSGDLDTFDEPERFSSRLGAAVQVQALAVPFEGLGFGLTAFANINASQSFGGVMFTLAFGQLR